MQRLAGRRACRWLRQGLPRHLRPAAARGHLRRLRRRALPARRRQRGDRAQPPRGVPPADRAADRLLPRKGCSRPSAAAAACPTTSSRTSRRCSAGRRRVIVRKSEAEVGPSPPPGTILADCLDMLVAAVAPGVRTRELDGMAERFIRGHGGAPTFLGYRGFPESICASPNDMVVHGIPGVLRVAEGDILSIDVGVTLDGFVADSAITVAVGAVERRGPAPARRHAGVARGGHRRVPRGQPARRRLARRAAGRRGRRLQRGALAGRPRRGPRDARGPADPQLRAGRQGPRLEEGMVFAIEPMVNAGGHDVFVPPTGGASTAPTARCRRISSNRGDDGGRAAGAHPPASSVTGGAGGERDAGRAGAPVAPGGDDGAARELRSTDALWYHVRPRLDTWGAWRKKKKR